MENMRRFLQIPLVAACLLAAPGAMAATHGQAHVNKYARVADYRGQKPLKAEASGVPAAPVVTLMQETETLGTVKVQWQAPATDVDGNAIDPATLCYRITTVSGHNEVTVADSLKGTSAIIKAYEPNEKDFAYFKI